MPDNTFADMRTYLFYVFIGFFATYIYNYCSNLLRAVGDSVTPLIFLGVSVVLNIILDLYFVIGLGMGIMGAAVATVISQYVAGLGILTYYIIKYPEYRVRKEDFRWSKSNFKNILSLSGYTCIQQSVMNLGILMVQGIVNGFGQNVMAAFAVAVISMLPFSRFHSAARTAVGRNAAISSRDAIRTINLPIWFPPDCDVPGRISRRRGVEQGFRCDAGLCTILTILILPDIPAKCKKDL